MPAVAKLRTRGRTFRPTSFSGELPGSGTGSGGTSCYPRSVSAQGLTCLNQAWVGARYANATPAPLIVCLEGAGTVGSNNTAQVSATVTSSVTFSPVLLANHSTFDDCIV